jgi:NTE family protein
MRWEERYPGVDIVLIEPDSTDELMFQTSIMNFASRIAIARHGFQSVAHHLAGEYEHYREVTKRHGLEISPERLRMVVEHFEAETAPAEEPEQDTSAWRRILEGTTGALLRQSQSAGV